jgi:Bifunctional DNA primase/polymerase, N-terminal
MQEYASSTNSSSPPTDALQQSLACNHAGIGTIPVRDDGSKAPALSSWDCYKERLATEGEIHSWFSRNGALGVAVVCGRVSGNLGVLDFEFPDFFQAWAELVEAERPGLVASLPLVDTPGKSGLPGKHSYFRSRHELRTGKLARLTEDEARERTGDPGKRTAIEIKAEGGYVLAPGCPAACHESGRLYRHTGGPFIEDTPVLDDDDVELLLSCARALDRAPAVTTEYHGRAEAGDGTRPGDVFNRVADWQRVLEPHGWVLVKVQTVNGRPVAYWRRPGKDKGVSATTGFCTSKAGGDLLCVFSTNAAPLEIPDGRDHQCFSKFGAYALLEHAGSFKKAAQALYVLGWLHKGGVRFAALRKLGKQGGSYEMKLQDGRAITFSGTAELTNQYRFRLQVAESLQAWLTPVTKKVWDRAVQCLLSLTRVEDLGTDEVEVLRNWVMRYLRDEKVRWHSLDNDGKPKSDDDVLSSGFHASTGDRDAIIADLKAGDPVWLPGKALYLSLDGFQEWLTNKKVSWISQQELGGRLRRAGFVRKTMSQPRRGPGGTKGRSQLRGWRAPDSWRADFEDMLRVWRRR